RALELIQLLFGPVEVEATEQAVGSFVLDDPLEVGAAQRMRRGVKAALATGPAPATGRFARRRRGAPERLIAPIVVPAAFGIADEATGAAGLAAGAVLGAGAGRV